MADIRFIRYVFKIIAKTLLYLHNVKNIAHNDMKIDNILLVENNNDLVPKLADFG